MFVKDVIIQCKVPARECGKSQDQFVKLEFQDALFEVKSEAGAWGQISYKTELSIQSRITETSLKGSNILDQIDRVIFNNPATIIIWADGSKTVVKAQDGEPFDQEKGLMACVMKKITGNKGTFNNTLKKWCK